MRSIFKSKNSTSLILVILDHSEYITISRAFRAVTKSSCFKPALLRHHTYGHLKSMELNQASMWKVYMKEDLW